MACCLPACFVVLLHVYQLAKTRVCAVRAAPVGPHVGVTDHSQVQRQSPTSRVQRQSPTSRVFVSQQHTQTGFIHQPEAALQAQRSDWFSKALMD